MMQYPSYFWWFECFIILFRFTSDFLFNDARSFYQRFDCCASVDKVDTCS